MTSVRIETLLDRADEESLRRFAGADVIRLLQLLDPDLARPSVLRRLVRDSQSGPQLLRRPETRKGLLLLLRPDEAAWLRGGLSDHLPGSPEDDPFAALDRMEFKAGSSGERRLFDLLGLNLSDAESHDRMAPRESESEVRPDYKLYSHQRDAVARTRVSLGRYPHRVLLHMPTGAGKTRVAMNAIAEHLRQQEPGLVIWLAYSEELCEQAASEFEQAWASLGNRSLTLHRYWGSHDCDLSQLRDGFIIAGLAKIYGVARQSVHRISTLADRLTMVVIDEAHVATAETYALVLDVLATKRAETQLLGLTATPGRSWADIDADEELAEFFSRRKVTLRVPGYESPVNFLTEQGYLARAEFHSLFYDGGIDPSPRDLVNVERALDIPRSLLERMAADEQRNLVVINEVERLSREHARLLVFAATVEHARLIGAVLRARGLDVGVVTSETPLIERNRVITRFRSGGGNPQVLCNYGVLTTGFDAPKVSAAVIARPTKSLILYSQMVGRAIRGRRMGGTETCEVVTVVDRELPGFGSVAESFMNWEDVWEEE